MELTLIRHGQPDWEPAGIADDNPTLTRDGHAQAEACAQALAGEHFDAIYTSPLRRAIETAAPIAKRLGTQPEIHSWLHEIRLPPLSGKTSEEVADFFRRSRQRPLDRWWEGLEGGESFRHFHERVSGGIEGLLVGEHRLQVHEASGRRLWRIPEEDRTRVLIVAHEGTNAVLLSHLLGIEPVPWEWLRFSSSWAGISRLHSLRFPDGATWVLESFNRTAHLQEVAKRMSRDGRSAHAHSAADD